MKWQKMNQINRTTRNKEAYFSDRIMEVTFLHRVGGINFFAREYLSDFIVKRHRSLLHLA